MAENYASRRGFIAGAVAAALAPRLARAESGPGLYIPSRVTAAGLMVSPQGGTTIVDLSTLPFGVEVPIYAVTGGTVILDAGPLGRIAPGGGRAVVLTGAVARITRSTNFAFDVAGALPCAAPPPRDVRAALEGQSLASMWSYTPALASLMARLREMGDGRTVGMVNGAVGGSAVLRRYAPADAPTHYWWDETTVSPGPLLRDAIARLRSIPDAEKPTHLVWMQGERDSGVYAGTTAADDAAFRSAYQAAVYKILDILRASIRPTDRYGVPAIVQRLGPRRNLRTGEQSMTLKRGMALVREAQAALVALPGKNIRWGAQPDVTLRLRDMAHPTDTSFEWIGARTAEAL